MKIINKTIRKAYNNWNPCKEIRCYHFSAAFHGTKLICFTKNNPIKTHTGAYRIGEDFNLEKFLDRIKSDLLLGQLSKKQFNLLWFLLLY